MDDRVTDYIAARPEWAGGLERFRALLLATELEETVKWGMPYYVIGSARAVGLAGFKSWIALWFERGYAMDDPLGVLVNASPDATKWQRQWRIADPGAVSDADVQRYVAEAIRATKEAVAAP